MKLFKIGLQDLRQMRFDVLDQWCTDKDNRKSLTFIFVPSAADGDYWRLLNPGEYQVVVWAEGYFPSMRHCHVGMEPRPTICDFNLTPTPIQQLKEIRAKGGKIPQDLQLRLRALRLRKLRASTKVLNRRRESQQGRQVRRARASRARRA